jgi:hypothetical protein
LTAIVAGQAFVAVLIGLWLGKRLGARRRLRRTHRWRGLHHLLGLVVFYKGFTG